MNYEEDTSRSRFAGAVVGLSAIVLVSYLLRPAEYSGHSLDHWMFVACERRDTVALSTMLGVAIITVPLGLYLGWLVDSACFAREWRVMEEVQALHRQSNEIHGGIRTALDRLKDRPIVQENDQQLDEVLERHATIQAEFDKADSKLEEADCLIGEYTQSLWRCASTPCLAIQLAVMLPLALWGIITLSSIHEAPVIYPAFGPAQFLIVADFPAWWSNYQWIWLAGSCGLGFAGGWLARAQCGLDGPEEMPLGRRTVACLVSLVRFVALCIGVPVLSMVVAAAWGMGLSGCLLGATLGVCLETHLGEIDRL